MITGSIQPKRGIWQTVINLKDNSGKRKPKWETTGLPVKGNKKKAEQILRERIAFYELQEGIVSPDTLFTDYIKLWLDRKKPYIEIDTYEGYETIVNSHLIPYFEPKKIKLCELTSAQLQKYADFKLMNGRADGKGGLSATSVKSHFRVIKQILKKAVKENYILKNPSDDVTLPKPQAYKAEIYTEQQLIELLNKIKDDPLIYLIILTSFLGLRRSEVLGLKWNSVNFETKEILIKETVVRNKTTISKKKTKNESSYRSYPLSDDIFNIILLLKEDEKKNAKKWGSKYNKNDYIFKHSDGRPFTPNYVSQHFKLILEKNSFKHIRFHDLRHSCASLFLAKGHSLKEIQLWLGHSNFSTTADIYAHLDTNSKKNMAETMSEVGKIALDKTLDTE